jgi:demethylmenaquinone methyltransferase/2-methoxy-6-polyprenyl-1,4-benzoquinol methylase
MFDRIAARYDLLNRLLSGRRDVAWRRRLAESVPRRPGLRVLDLATGTGDVLVAVCRRRPNVEHGVGLDAASGMLALARRKFLRAGLADRLSLVRSDAAQLPFPAGCFDVVTVAFGIRNVKVVPRALRELRRVLRAGGVALVLEFSLPANLLLRTLYLAYFRHILPRLGGLVSGDRGAYRYLNRTVEAFPSGTAFRRLMEQAGFEAVRAESLTFGIACLYRGTAL